MSMEMCLWRIDTILAGEIFMFMHMFLTVVSGKPSGTVWLLGVNWR